MRLRVQILFNMVKVTSMFWKCETGGLAQCTLNAILYNCILYTLKTDTWFRFIPAGYKVNYLASRLGCWTWEWKALGFNPRFGHRDCTLGQGAVHIYNPSSLGDGKCVTNWHAIWGSWDTFEGLYATETGNQHFPYGRLVVLVLFIDIEIFIDSRYICRYQ